MKERDAATTICALETLPKAGRCSLSQRKESVELVANKSLGELEHDHVRIRVPYGGEGCTYEELEEPIGRSFKAKCKGAGGLTKLMLRRRAFAQRAAADSAAQKRSFWNVWGGRRCGGHWQCSRDGWCQLQTENAPGLVPLPAAESRREGPRRRSGTGCSPGPLAGLGVAAAPVALTTVTTRRAVTVRVPAKYIAGSSFEWRVEIEGVGGGGRRSEE